MRKSQFSDTQIATLLEQAKTGTPLPKLCSDNSISTATFYYWRRKFRNKETAPPAPVQQDVNPTQPLNTPSAPDEAAIERKPKMLEIC